jgi:hypothetical protein
MRRWYSTVLGLMNSWAAISRLVPCALGERFHAEVGEEVVGGAQLVACVEASALSS